MTADAALRLDLPDEAATRRLGAALAPLLGPGDVVALRGELGSGKSVLARAVIHALGDPRTEVPSPTFTLVQIYELEVGHLYHFDLYRLDRPEDAYELGIEDAFADGISLIEWPERAEALLPRERLDVTLSHDDGTRRRALLAGSGGWTGRLAALDPETAHGR